MLNRRDFLKMAGAGLAAGCQTADGSAPFMGAANTGRLWGTPASHQMSGLMPASTVPNGILEIFLYGGLNPFDTFYVVPEYGDPKKGPDYKYKDQQWWVYQDETVYPERTVPHVFKMAGGGDRELLVPWRTDALGKTVNLGPFIYHLRERPDILDRMRMWVCQHDIFDHLGGVPYALTGHRRGALRLAGFGSHIERFWQERTPAGANTPFAYTIFQRDADIDANSDAASAVGLHPASARPLTLRLGPRAEDFTNRLKRRTTQGYQPELDAAVAHYFNRYRDRFRHPKTGDVVRSLALGDFDFARRSVRNHKVIADMFEGDLLHSAMASMCGQPEKPDDVTTSLKVAAHLLTHPLSPAKYVNVIEGALYPDDGTGGYDTHEDHVLQHASNTVHFFKNFVKLINEPGENDPRKIDLDKHMVMITTEFGRTPFPEYGCADLNFGQNYAHPGTDHWPHGYVVMGFGGPLDQERSGIVGAIGEDSYGINAISPSDIRAAMLLSAGIWPFTNETFAVSDVGNVQSELDGAAWLKEVVLGYKA